MMPLVAQGYAAGAPWFGWLALLAAYVYGLYSRAGSFLRLAQRFLRGFNRATSRSAHEQGGLLVPFCVNRLRSVSDERRADGM
ncbi:MAG: hypothetical protein Q4B13_03390 [Lautropia sp.]|nr:hypothetical protein [Lautropia sp.]